jgi:DNA-binding NtrC family response regulator
MARALIVDDDAEFVSALEAFVKRERFRVSTAALLCEARRQLADTPFDVVLADLGLPDGSGMDLLDDFEPGSGPEVVLITGQATLDTAVEALRRGATDYLTKPIDMARLQVTLGALQRTLEMKEQIGALRSELRKLGRFGPIVGASPAMQKVYDMLARVAPTEAGVLITGETGTGKELAAQTIHALSRRAKESFVAVNCGAVSPSLIESEMFGHERGSFTGAERQHKGHFERAHRGTIFLDEVTEMPQELQVKLLRVLETGTLLRVGGHEPVKVDVRVVAATNRPPEEAVSNGKLRQDLLFRLNVFPVHMPALRERGEDVVLIAQQFLGELNRANGATKALSKACTEELKRHSWPGNVRELRNVLQRAYILADEEVGIDALPLGARESSASSSLVLRVGTSIEEMERRLIFATLEHFEGDKKRAAAALDVSLKTLYNRLNEYKVYQPGT